MKVSIVGAGGGIGHRLVPAFGAHQVTGIYRSRKSAPLDAATSVLFGDRAALARAIGDAEIVIHAALNRRARGSAFLAENRAITETLLSLVDRSTCRLFVYFSSQVVYSGQVPQAGIYDETQPLAVTEPIDIYTRLKIDDEARVVAACAAAGIPYLIVRPTVVMGPGMDWSTGIVAAMRWAPVGVRGRTMNLVHVDDLATDLLALVEGGARNEIYNLGDRDVSTDEYFRCAAQVAKRRAILLPNAATGALGRLLPSTLWFLRTDLRIDCSRIRSVSPRTGARPLRDYFPASRWNVKADDLAAIVSAAQKGQPFEISGQGYSRWFNAPSRTSRLSLAPYSGVVGLEGDLVTVKAGTPLSHVIDFLDRHGLTLATLPEFSGISAGACFFTEVHGSSFDYISMYDLIERIGYVDARGEETVVGRDAGRWDQLRRAQGIIVTQVTFRCTPQHELCNRIAWQDEAALEDYLTAPPRPGRAVTMEWFPARQKLLVYNVTALEGPAHTDRAPFLPFRGLPYGLQRALIALRMRRKTRLVGKSHEILAPWRAFPLRSLVNIGLLGLKSPIKNMEVCVPSSRASSFIARLREAIADRSVVLGRHQGIGLRFSAHPETDRSFVWVETTSYKIEQLHQIVRLAQEVCGSEFWLHRGKYVPQGTLSEALFIPREVAAPLLRAAAGGR